VTLNKSLSTSWGGKIAIKKGIYLLDMGLVAKTKEKIYDPWMKGGM